MFDYVAVCSAQYQRTQNRFQQLNPSNNVISQHGRGTKRCYVCTGKFPDRDCELYPKYTQVSSDKKHIMNAFCQNLWLSHFFGMTTAKIVRRVLA